MKGAFRFLSVTVLAATLVACGSSNSGTRDNLVEVAEENGFTVLLAALEASGLDEVLADESRDFTVFAPTDAAFTALLNDLGLTAEELLALPNLADILLYHVIADAAIDAATAMDAAGTTITTANTDDVGISLRGMDMMDLFINGSRVETPDVPAVNGIIHVIDAVLLPTEDDPMSGTITAVAADIDDFSILVTALQTASLDGTTLDVVLAGEGPFTVFAPTNAAFTALLDDLGLTAGELLASPDLADILLYHVISGAEVPAAAAIGIAGNTVGHGK